MKRYCTCIICRKRWNISIFATLTCRGYICPDCVGKALP